MTKIYCDEAGNSGANLLDTAQPYFVLASNDFSCGEADEILKPTRSSQTNEVKFRNLKGSKSGVARLIEVLSDPRLNSARVAAHVIDKRYMIATKLVDLAMETVMHARGKNLYEDGANIGMSYMLHIGLPMYCGETVTEAFFSAFVTLIRDQNQQTRDRFFAAAGAAARASSNEQFKQLIEPFANHSTGEIWLPSVNKLALDPAIPALFHHVVVWGKRKQNRFEVVHDDSKPILATQKVFADMLAGPDEDSVEVGYGQRKFAFPLRATGLVQAGSKEHSQLQLADLCAGSINHLLKAQKLDNLDELASAVLALKCDGWVIGAVTPSTNGTPGDWQTDSRSGTDPITPIVDHLDRRRH